MANKTIYIRQEDVKVWNEAKELSGGKLAPIIMSALREYVKTGVHERVKVLQQEIARIKQAAGESPAARKEL